MCSANESLEYPNELAKIIIEEIIVKEGFIKYEVKVSSATGKGDNFAGALYRTVITGNKKNGDVNNLNLIMKTAPMFARDAYPVENIYKREFICYASILPMLDNLQKKYNVPEQDRFKYIKMYKGDLTQGSEILVLEDMNVLGFKMEDKRESLTADHMTLLIKELAALHASSFALKKHDKESYDKLMNETMCFDDYGGFMKGYLRWGTNMAIDAIDDPYSKEKVIVFAENVVEKASKYILPDDYAPYTVFSHGDCWTNNMLFRYENDKPVEVRLLDWQMIKHASPVIDIAYLMFTSTDEELRANHYERLLEIYYDTLKSNLAKLDCDINVCYPEQIYKMQIKKIMPFGLIMAFLTTPMFMSEVDDIPDMAEILKKDNFDKDDMQLKNEKSKFRYEQRMRGIVRDFVRLDLI